MLNYAVVHGSADWHALRSKHIGGSECAALWGMQYDYAQSLFALHMIKSGRIPEPPVDDSPGTRVWYGKMMEPVIAEMAAKLFRWKIRYPGPYAIDDTTPGLAASLDGIIEEPGEEETRLGYRGPGVLEIKRAEWLVFKEKWTGNEPPPPAILQTQHGMAASGLGWGVVVVLAGEVGLVPFRYRRREGIISQDRERVEEFWDRVRRDDPPNTDRSRATAEAISGLFPVRVAEPILDLLGNKAADLTVVEAINARANFEGSTYAKADAHNALNWILKEHLNAETDSYWLHRQKNGFVKISPKPESAKPKPRKRK